MTKDIKKEIMARTYLIYGFTLVFAVLIVGKLLHIHLVKGSKWRSYSKEINFGINIIKAERGNIFSSDGMIFCQSKPIYDIYWDPLAEGLPDSIFNRDINELGQKLETHFGIEKNKFISDARKIRNHEIRNRYYRIKKGISWSEYEMMKSFPIFERGNINGGFIENKKIVTDFPYNTLARRIIGDVDEEKGICFGLNCTYNEELRGSYGMQEVKRIKDIEWYPVSSDSNKRIEPKRGYDLVTTINLKYQDFTENELKKMLIENNADSGCVIVMEVATGQIKAITNLKKTAENEYIESDNYAVSFLIEPGSTMKLAALMVALEDGYINSTDTINCSGNLGGGRTLIQGHIYEDVHKGGYGKLSIKDIFKYSSNVGVTTIIEEHYNKTNEQREKFANGLRDLGIYQRVNTEIQNEPHPVIKNSEFSLISVLQMSIGYEIQMTPLQILTFFNAVANNGVMVKPMFASEIKEGRNTVRRFETEILKRKVASAETISLMREMLEAVVAEGSGKSINNTVHYKIAGKTGTAQRPDGARGYEGSTLFTSSFAGYFPADNPRYSAIAVLYTDKSKGGHFGGAIAAPIIKQIADRIYASEIGIDVEKFIEGYNQMPMSLRKGYTDDIKKLLNYFGYNFIDEAPTAQWVNEVINDRIISLNEAIIEDFITPDVSGMTLKDALFLLENMGFQVSFSGNGIVRSQLPNSGTSYKRGDIINLTLSI
ncbi:MAG: penicillin-binding protein [Bacteroidales bacterium]|nr:penicillin-binding protein [Bacteroidales bacterium]